MSKRESISGLIKNKLINIIEKIGSILFSSFVDRLSNVNTIHPSAINLHVLQRIYDNQRSFEEGRLLRYGFKVYSQNDEDGIIQEIFNRIGTTNQYFIEFGVERGLENNTLYLLFKNWKGLWIEGNQINCNFIKTKFKPLIDKNELIIVNEFITRENINDIIVQNDIPKEIDLLCIDIDGNDYHVIKAINTITPRVVVIEYNAKFPPPVLWVMKYNPNHTWDGTDYFGASLKSYERLFYEKGYSLVGCNITGANAFFVR